MKLLKVEADLRSSRELKVENDREITPTIPQVTTVTVQFFFFFNRSLSLFGYL